jgi:prepilin-type N-terminal cleavage/methylation domain-containing protein
MRIHSRHRGHSGFSLIEVLVAVIILSTGLLALAALQINLTSSSADAKARSRIASLLASVIDDERAGGYAGIASFGATACTTSSPTALQTMICTAQNEGGVSGLQLTQTSTTVGTYKNITLTATWTDAAGGSRSLGVNTIASALALGTGGTTLLSQSLTGGGSITPVAHQLNPSNTAGVIPIAVGTNENAAATNPTPNINHFTLPSTTFNVLTYTNGVNDTSSTATIQKRVETTVAECVCQGSGSNPISDTFLNRSTFRPTYWDGLKYSSPVDASITPYSTSVSSVTQDPLCVQCCRDHHDASGDVVKFDPFTGDLARYQVKTSSGAVVIPVALKTANGLLATTANPPLVANTSSDKYLDSCRLIRVDGLWRVAADLNAEHTGLVATTAKGFATSAVPDPSSAAAYEDFVIDYLGQKLTQLLSSGSAPVANSVFASHGLNDPTNIDAPTTAGAYRYLHGRGLYLDHLEQAAIDKLNAVNSTCAVADYPTCLLPFLPFNTINVTELATWASSATGILTVTNASTACVANAPIRGCAKGVAVGSATATATMGHSNSAVASSLAINPYELNVSNQQTDSQAFTITGTDTASEFFVALSGLAAVTDLSTSDDPSVSWTVGANSDFCFSNISRTDTNPDPYDCVTTVALALPVTVTLGSYNAVTNQQIANPCPGGLGTWSQPVLTCNTITATSITGTSGSPYVITPTVTGTKTTGEQTALAITATNPGTPNPIVKSAATLNVTFSANGSANGSYTCDVLTNNPTFTTPTSCP